MGIPPIAAVRPLVLSTLSNKESRSAPPLISNVLVVDTPSLAEGPMEEPEALQGVAPPTSRNNPLPSSLDQPDGHDEEASQDSAHETAQWSDGQTILAAQETQQ